MNPLFVSDFERPSYFTPHKKRVFSRTSTPDGERQEQLLFRLGETPVFNPNTKYNCYLYFSEQPEPVNESQIPYFDYSPSSSDTDVNPNSSLERAQSYKFIQVKGKTYERISRRRATNTKNYYARNYGQHNKLDRNIFNKYDNTVSSSPSSSSRSCNLPSSSSNESKPPMRCQCYENHSKKLFPYKSYLLPFMQFRLKAVLKCNKWG